MKIEEIKKTVNESPEYEFLREKGKKNEIALLCIAGSHGYGLATEESDIDIRGIFLRSADELLLEKSSEQLVEPKTDTCLYSLSKAMRLMANCNPNVIEWLGLKPECYIKTNVIGSILIQNADIFLSKKAFTSFGGYAKQKLNEIQLFTGDESELDKRTRYAIKHGKLCKHVMNLFRLYYIGTDILEKGEIITYREAEHDLLMTVRSGGYCFDADGKVNDKFWIMGEQLEARLHKAMENTKLPSEPDWKQINLWLKMANARTMYKYFQS